MKKYLKYAAYLIVAFLIIGQFFRIDKSAPESVAADDFITVSNPPEEITTILKTACYDCHSHQSTYPWYSNVAPVSWWIKDHINEAREELNFSTWNTFTQKRKDHKLEEISEEVEEGEMPLKSYLWTHDEARLTDDQRTKLSEWFKEYRKSLAVSVSSD